MIHYCHVELIVLQVAFPVQQITLFVSAHARTDLCNAAARKGKRKGEIEECVKHTGGL